MWSGGKDTPNGILPKIAVSTPLPPDLGGVKGDVGGGTPHSPRQRGSAPCGIPIFVLRGAPM